MISELLDLTVSFLHACVLSDISPWAPCHWSNRKVGMQGELIWKWWRAGSSKADHRPCNFHGVTWFLHRLWEVMTSPETNVRVDSVQPKTITPHATSAERARAVRRHLTLFRTEPNPRHPSPAIDPRGGIRRWREGRKGERQNRSDGEKKLEAKRKPPCPIDRSLPPSLHDSSPLGVVWSIRSRDGLRELRPIPDSSGYSFLASCLFPLEFAQIGGSWILSWSL